MLQSKRWTMNGLSLKTCIEKFSCNRKSFRFLLGSTLVTLVDYVVFFSFLTIGFNALISNISSYSVAICFSFILHKSLVFKIQRKRHTAFILVVLFSLIGICLSTSLLLFLFLISDNIIMSKLLATITMFFYNFHTKEFAYGDQK